MKDIEIDFSFSLIKLIGAISVGFVDFLLNKENLIFASSSVN